MHKKGDSEKFIRYLCHEWAKGLSPDELKHPSYLSFKEWASLKGYSHYWKFRSSVSADYDAEMWFDQEFKQMWRR